MPVLENRRHGIARHALTRLVHRDNSVFPIFAAFLVVEGGFGFDGHGDEHPIARRAFAALDFVRGHGAAVGRFFPVQEDPAFALARRVEAAGLAGKLEGGGGGGSASAEHGEFGVAAAHGVLGVVEVRLHGVHEFLEPASLGGDHFLGGGLDGHDLIAEGDEGVEFGLERDRCHRRGRAHRRIVRQAGDDVLRLGLDFSFTGRETRHYCNSFLLLRLGARPPERPA